MLNFHRNNLHQASSPYLQQHQNNPIHWQEWNTEVLEYAQKNHKIILVSIGYAACHWCHVMARQAFSYQASADFLNTYFVCIKVDREQRPDLDHYCMSFIQETQGQGGWPLNIFMTPEGKPFFAITYVPVEPQFGRPAFLELLHFIKTEYEHNQNSPDYLPHPYSQEGKVEEPQLIFLLKKNFSSPSSGPQFPPHCTILFLLHYYEQNPDAELRQIMEALLDKMATSGLHDHLQGGFYRYCVDETWTIPHFEKMLYDQAMLLWVYSTAYKIISKPTYKIVAEKVICCLEETFADAGLYYSSHDADTDHEEGATYLWTKEELEKNCSPDEFKQFFDVYELMKSGNGELGVAAKKNHLIKKKLRFLPETEKKLLTLRKRRVQPFVDKKQVTSWNALLGIGLLMASRYLPHPLAKVQAENLFKALWEKHFIQGKISHSSWGEKIQSGEFLEDYAGLLLFATYLSEENEQYLQYVETLFPLLLEFKEKQRIENSKWIESKTDDFPSLPASEFDHPIPSSVSLAEMAELRASIILGKPYQEKSYRPALSSDFYNLMAFMSQGNWHCLHTPHALLWKQLPLNSLQIKSAFIQDCYQQRCIPFKDLMALRESLRRSA